MLQVLPRHMLATITFRIPDSNGVLAFGLEQSNK